MVVPVKVVSSLCGILLEGFFFGFTSRSCSGVLMQDAQSNLANVDAGRRRKIQKTILCSDCHSVHVVTEMNQEDLNSAPEQQLRQFLTAMDVSSEDSVERASNMWQC